MAVKRREGPRRAPDPGAGALGEADPRQRIVLATVEVIEREGVANATVRRIVEAAGVNIAAVNYYFGTKDRLIEQALAHALHEGLVKTIHELEQALAAAGEIHPGTRAFLEGYLAHAFHWPTIAVAHFRNALLAQDYGDPAVAAFRNFTREFCRLVSPGMPGPAATHRARVELAWSGVVALTLMPRLFDEHGAAADVQPLVGALMVSLFGTEGPRG